MPFKKIKDSKWTAAERCRDPEHEPPGMVVLKPGTYKYSCPACGATRTIVVRPPHWAVGGKASGKADSAAKTPFVAAAPYTVHRPDGPGDGTPVATVLGHLLPRIASREARFDAAYANAEKCHDRIVARLERS